MGFSGAVRTHAGEYRAQLDADRAARMGAAAGGGAAAKDGKKDKKKDKDSKKKSAWQ